MVYFRPTGSFCSVGSYQTESIDLPKVWEEIIEMRRMGRLPGLRPNSGRDFIVLVDVIDHPKHRPHLIIPPAIDDGDVTPVRVPTAEMRPLVRVVDIDSKIREALAPRTLTPNTDDEITPVDADAELERSKPKP